MGEVEEEREEVIGCPVNQECIYCGLGRRECISEIWGGGLVPARSGEEEGTSDAEHSYTCSVSPVMDEPSAVFKSIWSSEMAIQLYIMFSLLFQFALKKIPLAFH